MHKKQAPVSLAYDQLPTFDQQGNVQTVIEIPAGTNKKIAYHHDKQQFIPDTLQGNVRSIDFLPYIGNYGFIPSTYSDPKKGGDGDALDILVLSEAVPTKSIVSVIPIAIVRLEDDGDIDDKVIAVPYDKKDRIIEAENFKDFSTQYPYVRKIIHQWLLHYDTHDSIHIKAWQDEQAAMQEIKKWQR